MQLIKKLTALLLALVMVLSCAALAEETVTESVVLATINGEEITSDDVEYYAYLLYYYGYTETYPDYESALNYLVNQAVIDNRIRAEGLNTAEGEVLEALKNEAATTWEEALTQYVDYYLTEDTEAARAELRLQAIAYYEASDYNEEVILDELLLQEGYDKLEEMLLAGYTPTEEEILNTFNEIGAQYQEMFENDIPSYEYYTTYYGYESWYTPAGYRNVLYIMLESDEDLCDAYNTALTTYEELASDETTDEAALAAAKTALDDARTAVLASCQEETDAIYDSLQSGTPFKELIVAYNVDDIMNDVSTMETGIPVHANSILYSAGTIEGAFSEKMQAVGDCSEPVVDTGDVYIYYYLSDVESGLIMTDAISTEIAEYLLQSKSSELLTAAITTWKTEMEITLNQEAIDALIATASDAE